MSPLYRIALVAAAVVPLACGGGSGLPGGKKASDLSESEVRQFCDWMAEAMEPISELVTESFCYSGGVMAGQFAEPGTERQVCEASVKQCREMSGEDEEFEDDGDCVPQGCDATVAELERCIKATVDSVRDAFSEEDLSCDPSTWSSGEEEMDEDSFEDLWNPEECRSLPPSCRD